MLSHINDHNNQKWYTYWLKVGVARMDHISHDSYGVLHLLSKAAWIMPSGVRYRQKTGDLLTCHPGVVACHRPLNRIVQGSNVQGV